MAVVFVGAVVGGGFASGRELWLFFAGYGPKGILGALLSGALLAAAGFAAARRAAASPPGYAGLFRTLPASVVSPFDALVFAFLFASFGVVLAGGGALAREALGLPYDAGVLALAVPLAACLAAGERGILAASALLTPMLVALVAGLSGLRLAHRALISAAPGALPSATPTWDAPASASLPVPWWWAACLYAAYNGLIGVVAIASLDRTRLQSPGAASGAACGGLFLGGLASLATAALLTAPHTATDALPLLSMARESGDVWRWAYPASLYAALFTTGAAAGFGMAERLPARPAALRAWFPLASVALALPLTRAGLPALVRIVYPLVAYAALLLAAWGGLAALRPRARPRA